MGILLLVVSSCIVLDYYTDTFAGTESTFNFIKGDCRPGDSLSLTLTIKGDTEVKIYEQLEHTLKVWIELKNIDNASTFVWPADSIGWKELKPRQPGELSTYTIRESDPLEFELSVFIRDVPRGNSIAI